jgi:hypothetical protein
MAGDDDPFSLDSRRNSPPAVALGNGESIGCVADMALTTSDDADLSVSRRICGNRGHQIHAEHWLQNIRALRHQELDVANVLSCDAAKPNFPRAGRRNAAADDAHGYKTCEKAECGLHKA